jgi:hypothetical protein
MGNTGIGGVIGAAGSVVETAVRTAAARSGIDFSYLFAQAKIESGLNAHAQAKTSSATGLFQFTAGTWLDTVRKHGADHGLGWAAKLLKNGASNLSHEARSAILALRHDAEASANMAAAFAADNRDTLQAKLGHAVGATELYLAHFLGAGGATRFLAAKDANGATAAASVAPAAARANRSIFYAQDGRPRTVSEIFDRFAAKLDGNSSGKAVPPTGNALPVTQLADAVTPAVAVNPATARLAYLLLAELGA